MTALNDTNRALFLTALMITSVLAGTVAFAGAAGAATVDAPTADSGADASRLGGPAVAQADDGQVAFANSSVNVTQGDVAEITVQLGGPGESGTLIIGQEGESGYQANVSVRDGDGDGTVTVRFNTYVAGHPNEGQVVSAADQGDNVTLLGTTALPSNTSLLAPIEYTMELGAGSPATVDETPDAISILGIQNRSAPSMRLWTAPDSIQLNSPSDVAAAVEAGTLTRVDDGVAAGDVVVHQVSASGLQGLIERYGGLSAAIGAGALELSITETDATVGRNDEPKSVNVSATPLTLLSDPASDTYYVAVDTGEIVLQDRSRSVAPGDVFRAELTIADDRLAGGTSPDDEVSVNRTFEVVERQVSFDQQQFQLSAAANQTVSGTTTVAPGTEFTVRLRSTADTRPAVLKIADVTVTENGTFNATFDLSTPSGIGEGDEFVVRTDGIEPSAEATATIAAGAAGQATGTTNTTTAANATNVTTTATETAGNETNVTTAAAGTSTAEATDTPTETPTEAPTETPTEAATETQAAAGETGTAEATGTGTGTSTSTPGFGAGLAVVALVGAALLALRREN